MFYSFSIKFFYDFWGCFYAFLLSFVFYLLLLRLWVYFPPMLMITKNTFLSIPTVYSILSVMLQAIFQRLMRLLVVFFYLLILKGPAFLPGLVLPPETGWVHFVLDSPFSLGYYQRSPQRSQAGGPGANSVSGLWGSGKGARTRGHPGRSPHSYWLVFFLMFLARLQYHVPGLMCQTFFLVHK